MEERPEAEALPQVSVPTCCRGKLSLLRPKLGQKAMQELKFRCPACRNLSARHAGGGAAPRRANRGAPGLEGVTATAMEASPLGLKRL